MITGCSTGLGSALAQEVLRRGDRVVVTARDASRAQGIVDAYPDSAVAAALDVTEPAQVRAAVELANERFARATAIAPRSRRVTRRTCCACSTPTCTAPCG